MEKWRARAGWIGAGRARRLLPAHRLPAGAALLRHQVAHRLGARARLRRLPGGHRQALRGGGQRRAEAGGPAGVRGLEAGPSGPGSGQPSVLYGGRGLRLGAGAGEGLQLRRPDRGFLRQRVRRPHQFRLQGETAGSLDGLFTRYSATLHHGRAAGAAILNYLSSHDDGSPYDRERRDPLGAGTRLLLAPGGAQIYYGDELARPLKVPGAEGDANLRSFMNWGDLERGGAPRGPGTLAEAGPVPPGPSGRGGRHASHPSGEAVHLQPHARDGRGWTASWWRWIRARAQRPYRSSAYSPRAPSWWMATRVSLAR